MHLLLHASAPRELTLSRPKVHHLSSLYQEVEQLQGFGLIFFPRLTYLACYLPWLRYLTGGIIGDGGELKRKIAIAKELVGTLMPMIERRVKERESGEVLVDDQMQVLMDEGDDASAIIDVRRYLSSVVRFH